MNENKEASDVASRIQARILKEVRQELGVERAKVKILKERLAEEETLANTLRNAFDVERDESRELLAAAKDKIDMLKKRVNSVNNEYNNAYGVPASERNRRDYNDRDF